MGELWYMDKELEGNFYSGWDAEKLYDSYQTAHLNPKSSKYGAVLCTTKRIHYGWTIKIRISFKYPYSFYWKWRPAFKWKWGERYFHWLFFNIWLEKEYTTVLDKVIKDHLSDHLQEVSNG
jgi:hypothetical protein